MIPLAHSARHTKIWRAVQLIIVAVMCWTAIAANDWERYFAVSCLTIVAVCGLLIDWMDE